MTPLLPIFSLHGSSDEIIISRMSNAFEQKRSKKQDFVQAIVSVARVTAVVMMPA